MIIHVFGRIFMDLFIFGEKVHNSKIVETPGGSALNASLGFSLLGMKTYLHASYGTDHLNETIESVIHKYNVQTQYLIQKNEPTNRFVSKNGTPLAVSVAPEPPFKLLPETAEEDYCLLFATETNRDTLERVLTVPWKGLFIDLGPKFVHNPFVYKIDHAIIIGNEKEAQKNNCDVIKLGKNGARWHEISVPGNGKALPYTTGAGDLFDVVFIYNFLKETPPIETLEEAVHLSQKACMIPGSSTKVELLRDFYHSV